MGTYSNGFAELNTNKTCLLLKVGNPTFSGSDYLVGVFDNETKNRICEIQLFGIPKVIATKNVNNDSAVSMLLGLGFAPNSRTHKSHVVEPQSMRGTHQAVLILHDNDYNRETVEFLAEGAPFSHLLIHAYPSAYRKFDVPAPKGLPIGCAAQEFVEAYRILFHRPHEHDQFMSVIRKHQDWAAQPYLVDVRITYNVEGTELYLTFQDESQLTLAVLSAYGKTSVFVKHLQLPPKRRWAYEHQIFGDPDDMPTTRRAARFEADNEFDAVMLGSKDRLLFGEWK